MAKPISTQTHAIFDYISVPILLTLPRLLNWNQKATNLLTGVGLGILATSLMTRYELGLFKLLPMPGHLAIDMTTGAAMTLAPFTLFDETERDGTLIGALAGIGLSEITLALLTRPETSFDSDNMVNVIVNRARETIGIDS